MPELDLRHWFLKYGWAVNLVLLAGISLTLAMTTNDYLAASLGPGPAANAAVPGPAVPASPGYRLPVENIVSRDLFGATRKAAGGTTAAAGDTTGVVATTLRLKLIGIAFLAPEHANNLATIQNLQDQSIELYRPGDTVSADARVQAVEMDRVILARQNGELEELLLNPEEAKASAPANPDQPPIPGTPPPGASPGSDLGDKVREVGQNQYVVQKSAIDETLGNLNTIITQAKVIPNFTGEGDQRTVDGFRIYRIIPGSIFQYLGLQNGDVIKSINGQKMDNVEKGLQLLQSLRNESRFAISVERQGQPIEKHYEVQ